MNRTELITELTRHTGLSADGARRAVETIFGTASATGLIGTALQKGDRVQLAGFGTFETRYRKERPGRNPHTRQSIVIPASVAPVFKPAGHLKAACAAPDEQQPAAAQGRLGRAVPTPFRA